MMHLYVLRLQDECYYVGITQDLNRRWAEHCGMIGKDTLFPGAKWTHLHKPLELLYHCPIPSKVRPDLIENTVTMGLMALIGSRYVRGGKWCQLHTVPNSLSPLKSSLATRICQHVYESRLNQLLLGDNPHYATI